MTKKQWSSACQDDDFITVFHLYFEVFLTGLGIFSFKLVGFWFFVGLGFGGFVCLFSCQFEKKMENIEKKIKETSVSISEVNLYKLEIV